MIALRVQDPAARHEEAICHQGRPDSLFGFLAVFKTIGNDRRAVLSILT